MTDRLIISAVAVLTVLNVTSLRAEDWPRFRGPDGSSVSSDTKIPTQWGDTENLKWKVEMPGAGFSSPIVVGDRVFVTCYTGGTGDLSDLKRYLVCVSRENGKILWTKTVDAVLPEFQERGGFAHHGYASHTPVSDGERVYVLFGNTGVIVFDLKGNELWRQSVGAENNAMFGSASSPILYKDMVIVTAGAESESIRAFDKKTGKEVWKAEAAPLSGGYTTPLVVSKDGQDELLIAVPGEVWSLNPSTGKLNWYAETEIDQPPLCPSLITQDNILYVMGGRNAARAAIKIGGKDDVTQENVVWSKRGGSYVPSPVLYKGHLYYVDRQGIVYCIDAKTGEEVASERFTGNFYASPTVIDDKLYLVSRFDGTYVLEANPSLKELAHNQFSDESDFSGSPAVSNGQLFLRSDEYLYCIEAK